MFDLISGWIATGGPWGVFALMVLENIFPPIPSELVMPLAGFQAAEGTLSLLAVLLAGIAGSVAGALPWFYAGRLVGRAQLRRLAERHGVWLTMEAGDVDATIAWFDRHGGKAVFLGRMVPGVRTLISVPAGLADMALIRFLILTALGSAVWVSLLTAAGYLLRSQYERIGAWLDPVTTAIVIGIVGLYLFRLIRMLLRRRTGSR
ncbi:DedA family protein [uncultured Jannaschia sp.]|uniref:DedA family protein n=1 Tax=uncultured Jannaschia sp. TaxID=293347 RepID=UPI0026314820|nr:DedA family protein [uncultured Jannaschia sp.]